MSGMNDFAPYVKKYGCFIVRNITPDRKKTIQIFKYPILFNTTRDILQIPGVSEADIRASLLKGELRHKILAKDIVVECSDIDLLQFNLDQKSFLESAGIVNGLEVSGGTGGFDVQDATLIGTRDNVNTTFTTPTPFKHTSQFKEVLFVNGLRQHIPEDYFVAESGGPGTGYDTIVFVTPPFPDDILTIDYFEVI
jgi:hypothetical protein